MRLSISQLCALLLVMSLLGSPSSVEGRKRRHRNRKPVFVPYIFSLFGENGEYNLKKKSTPSPHGSTMEPTTVQSAMNSTTAEVKTLSPNGETKSTMSPDSVSLSNSTLLSVIFQVNSSMSDTLTTLTTTSPATTTGYVKTADQVTTESYATTESYVTTSVASETNRSVKLTEGESTPKNLNEQDVGNSTELGLSEKINDKENTTSTYSDVALEFNETSSQQFTFQSSTETTIKKAEVFTTLNDEILRFDDDDDDNRLSLDSLQNISKALDKDQTLKSDSVTKNPMTTTIEKTPKETTTLVVPLETTLTTSMPSSTAETQKAEVTTKTTKLQTAKLEKTNTRGKLYSTTISPFLEVLGIRIIRTKLNEEDLELQNANDQGVQGYRAGYLWKSWTHRLWKTRGNQGHKCIVPLWPKFTWFFK